MADVLTGVLIVVLTMSSRSGTGRRDTCSLVANVVIGVVADVHTVRDIDPSEPANMSALLAFEWTHSAPQSVCLNDIPSLNM